MASKSPSGRPWRDVTGGQNYRVSDDGRVWSSWSGSWKELVQQKASPIAYRYVELRTATYKKKKRYVAPLVLAAFKGPKPPGHESCHFPNRDPGDNRLSNLKWGTPQENWAHKRAHGTVPGAYKVTDAQARRIRWARAAGESVSEIAKREGLHSTTVSGIASFDARFRIHQPSREEAFAYVATLYGLQNTPANGWPHQTAAACERNYVT